jgi:23S rRNA (cytosine1962-C5)-methyltransferase
MTSSVIKDTIYKAVVKRKPLYRLTNAVRLVNGKGDGLKGLVIEQYDRHFVIHIFDHAAQVYVPVAIDFLKDQFPLEYLILKDRSSREGQYTSHIIYELEGSRTIVKENGLNFAVDLNDTVNTGLFLDMRRNRKMIGDLSAGKEVLNCFAYTCSFGVYARAHQAKRVENVDINLKTLNKGKENYKLNHLNFSETEFRRSEVGEYLKRAKKHDNFFDVIILEQPSFARADDKVFSIQKDLEMLLGDAQELLKPSGALFVSTNSSEFSCAILKKEVHTLAKSHKRKIKSIKECGQDIDFPGSGTMKESCLSALLVLFE